MTTAVDKLVQGYRTYRDGSFENSRSLIEDLVERGQRPEVAVIACSDSRVDPAILFQADPGDLFVVRNVANLVPPMEEEGTYHGTSAALEFAVLGLGVKHLVVLGHAHCGGIKLMMDTQPGTSSFKYVSPWVSMLAAAHRRVLATMGQADDKERTQACEQNAVLVSLENLTTFSWVRERVESGDLQLHGWYVDIALPELSAYDWESGKFKPFG
ncbi:MAG: carbonic anhydrase [Gammaproteobacteria bacterium]|jgi:carbonic anhydrase|nr:carbonic anhydrase [Gammaproteobacteria bacterium]